MSTLVEQLKQGKTISVVYKGKKYIVNVTEELTISESIINKQLKEIPSSYYFLCSIRNDYIKRRDNKEREKNLAYSKAWLLAKNSDSGCSNDKADHMAESNMKYQSLCEEHIKLASKTSDLISLCKAYEEREDILRTLSANLRSEK